MNEQDQARFKQLLESGKPSGCVFKTVDYFGIDITIPVDHDHIVTNKDGRVFSYAYNPKIAPGHDRWFASMLEPQEYCEVYNIGQTVEMWQDTYMFCP